MPELKGNAISIVPRVPYIPIEPWDWFKENGLEDKNGEPPPMMGEGPKLVPSVYVEGAASGQGTYTLSSGGTLIVC